MKLHITYCSKNKREDEGKLPAIQRYNSERIKRIKQLADSKREDFAILSGKHGLITAKTQLTYYDKLLQKEDVKILLPKVRKFLRNKKPAKIIYHTKEVKNERKPYFNLIETASKQEEIKFEKKLINQDI